MSTLRTQLRRWLPGTALALLGALLVRLVAPQLEGTVRQGVALAGSLLAPVGLYLLARRLNSAAAASASASPAAALDAAAANAPVRRAGLDDT